MGDVVRGKIGTVGDVDYFKFTIPKPAPAFGYFLLDVEARNLGSSLDSMICIEDAAGNSLACNDDTDTLDSLLLFGPHLSGNYYVRLTELSDDAGGNDYYYDLIVSRPLLISANAAGLGTGTVAGIKFNAPDILSWSHLNTGEEKWVLLFDASDLGITKNIANIHHAAGLGLLIGFATNQYLASIGRTVTPFEFLTFQATRIGPNTMGWFHGGIGFASYSLSTASEKIDAFTCVGYYPETDEPDGRYECSWDMVSTIGAAKVEDSWFYMKWQDEDLTCLTHEDLTWSQCVDGTQMPGLASEDIYAASVPDNNSNVLVTILGSGNISGHIVTQKDIFEIRRWPPPATWVGLAWHGPDHGWNYNIDAIEWVGW